MKKVVLLLLLTIAPLFGQLQAQPQIFLSDSTALDLDEAVVVASPKLSGKLRQRPVSTTLLSASVLDAADVRTLSDVSALAPNFFMPAYGSSQSGAIYIRGVGSRINTPAVAMYVDDVPMLERSSFSYQFLGVNRVDVLRGPQATLYGRNAMGGLIHVHTINPLLEQSTTLRSGWSSCDSRRYLSALTNQKLARNLGLSAGVYGEMSDGAFYNDSLRRYVGGANRVGGRVALAYRPTDRWRLNLSMSYDYTDEDAYPYYYNGIYTAGSEPYPAYVGRVATNRASNYRRSLWNAGFTAQYQGDRFTLSSVTGYQNLNDRMLMDQDFLPTDFYTLEQRQRSNILTQEFSLKAPTGQRWDWTGGLFLSWQTMRTSAPVTFYGDGVAMINGALANLIPPLSMMGQTMPLSVSLTDQALPTRAFGRTPILNGAVYFQNTLHDVLNAPLDVTVGLRLDCEHQSLTYDGGATANYLYTMPMGQPAALISRPELSGRLTNDYLRLLPKVSIQYNLPDRRGNFYATVSEGLRSGGYNIQMFSDLLTAALRSTMMDGVRNHSDQTLSALAAQPNLSPAQKQMFESIRQTMLSNMPTAPAVNVQEAVTYRPEYLLNYEVGAHLNLLPRRLWADFSAFFMDTHNQQIARLVASGMGRVMVNVGRSHSCGLEASLRGHLLRNRLTWQLGYGYTHAEFRRYDDGSGSDYTGNAVPFIPVHTVSLVTDYRIALGHGAVRRLTLGAQLSGLGRIYWTEDNSAWQDFYATLGAHATLGMKHCDLKFWGKNLTDHRHDTFLFQTLGRSFSQRGLPLQLGADLIVRF